METQERIVALARIMRIMCTGYHFKAILSPSHHGKPDLVKSHRPPFVHSRLSANPQHNS